MLPVLRRQDEAHIVNMASMVGLLGLPHNAVYALTKGAVRSFSEALRGELVGTAIGLTTVFPGAHRTGITETARGSQRALLAEIEHADHGAEIAVIVARRAHIGEQQLPEFLIQDPRPVQPYRRDANALLEDFSREWHRSGRGAAHVTVVRARSDVTEQAGLRVVHCRDERDIRKVSSAPERIVDTYHVARVQASEFLEGRLHAHRHRAQVDGHVVS